MQISLLSHTAGRYCIIVTTFCFLIIVVVLTPNFSARSATGYPTISKTSLTVFHNVCLYFETSISLGFTDQLLPDFLILASKYSTSSPCLAPTADLSLLPGTTVICSLLDSGQVLLTSSTVWN